MHSKHFITIYSRKCVLSARTVSINYILALSYWLSFNSLLLCFSAAVTSKATKSICPSCHQVGNSHSRQHMNLRLLRMPRNIFHGPSAPFSHWLFTNMLARVTFIAEHPLILCLCTTGCFCVRYKRFKFYYNIQYKYNGKSQK